MPDLFSGNTLFNDPTSTPSAFHIVTAVFALFFLASAFAYWRRARLARDNPVRRRLIRRVASAGMWTSAIGLVLCAARYSGFEYVDYPIWLYLLALIMIAIVGYFVYDISERYPLAVWRLQESNLERRYRPTPKPRLEPQRVRPNKVRGKRRK
jgi:hypothetical protein